TRRRSPPLRRRGGDRRRVAGGGGAERPCAGRGGGAPRGTDGGPQGPPRGGAGAGGERSGGARRVRERPPRPCPRPETLSALNFVSGAPTLSSDAPDPRRSRRGMIQRHRD